jgi:hypothetical protein
MLTLTSLHQRQTFQIKKSLGGSMARPATSRLNKMNWQIHKTGSAGDVGCLA